MAEGQLQREGDVIHVIVKSFTDLTHLLKDLTSTGQSDLPLLTLSRGDERVPKAGRDENKLRKNSGKSQNISFPLVIVVIRNHLIL